MPVNFRLKTVYLRSLGFPDKDQALMPTNMPRKSGCLRDKIKKIHVVNGGFSRMNLMKA